MAERPAAGPGPTHDPAEDDALVAAIRRGDPRAFDTLYRRYRPRLARFVGNFVRSPPVAEEIADDALVAFWERPHGFAGASRFSTWLFAVAYRKALRVRHRPPPPADVAIAAEADPPPDQEAARERMRAVLLRALDALSAEHRAVVDLTYFHEIGYREIAEIMGCPVDTVKTRMFHARRQLRRSLAGELSDWI